MSLLSILPLLSCAQPDGDGDEPRIVKFDYHYDGTIGGNSHTYTVRVADGKATVIIEDMTHWDYGEMTDSVSMEFVQALEALCRKHHIKRYDGFNGSNRFICDGYGFSLYIKYANGESVSAHGMNEFPKGYRDFSDELHALFEPVCQRLCQAALRRQKDAGVSGEPRYAGTYFSQSGDVGSDKYEAVFSKYENQMYNLEIRVKSVSGEFFPEGEKSIYRKVPVDSIDWKTLADMVKKYDMVEWMDWNGHSEDYMNKEWFQIDWEFEDGHIKAHGTAHPENYDAFRKEFLTFLRKVADEEEGEK